MSVTPESARTAAFFYALIVLLLGAMLVLSLLDEQPVPWRKVVGNSAVSLVAALIPFGGWWLGQRVSKTDRARRIVSWSVVLACAVPLVLPLLAMMSAEPLAMLSLLYAPPIQAVVIAGAVLAAALGKRDDV